METLFTHDVRRHIPGYMQLMRTKYPSIERQDYFEKIALSANYTSYPPVMDVISFEDIQEAGTAESLTLCNRNIGKVLDSHGALGLMRTTFQEGQFSGVYHQIFHLKWGFDDDEVAYEHRKHLPPTLRRKAGVRNVNRENGTTTAPMDVRWDTFDETILQSGLTIKVFSSCKEAPTDVIKSKTVEYYDKLFDDSIREKYKSQMGPDLTKFMENFEKSMGL